MTAKRRHKEVGGKVSYFYGIVFIAIVVGLYGAIYGIDHAMPTPLKIEDEVENPDSFIAERARDFLKPLVEIGPRVVGHSNNEISAVYYLTQTIQNIIDNKHESQEITFNVQEESGSFFLNFKPNGAINVYENIQNVVVKIHSKNSPHSVLVNSHFDTVPNSPGGSDDGINVAISLEILNKLSKLPERPTHNVIFLFNGAEEAALCGSHAFITRHSWAKEVRVFVNLEASGAGGREILFQTGPDEPWLLRYYDVPHPHANAGAEEVFQANIIPSDTDFRIFRDFGGIVGYDFAYYKDGYRYHTKFDGIDNIDLSSYQHTGDNILHLVKNLAAAPELAISKAGNGGKTVFFDVFGLFFVHYTMQVNMIINIVLTLVSVLLLIWGCVNVQLGSVRTSLIYATLLAFLNLLGWFLTGGILLIIATILDVTNRSMSWYSVPALNFLLYVAPTCALMLVTSVIGNRVIRHKTLAIAGKVLIQVHVIRIIWTIPLIVLTILGYRVAIFFLFGVLFNSVAMLIIHILDVWSPKLTRKIWLTLYIISTIIPTMIIYLYGHMDVALFTPMFGRFGADINPDLLVVLIVSSFTVLIASYYTPLFVYIQKPWYVIAVLFAIFIAGIILAYTPVGFPYTYSETNPRLQRYTIYHTKRTIRSYSNETLKEDSGFYLFKNDRNTPHSIEGHVSLFEKAVSLKEDCDLAPGCGVPITSSRNIEHLEDSLWIPSKNPPFDSRVSCDWFKTRISSRRTKYFVNVTGSDKIDVFISIRNGYSLVELSLLDNLPEKYIKWKDQVTYYVSFVYGKTPSELSFDFTLETSLDWPAPAVDLAVTAKFVHEDRIKKSAEYKELLDEFPEWTAVTIAGLAQYEHVVLT